MVIVCIERRRSLTFLGLKLETDARGDMFEEGDLTVCASRGTGVGASRGGGVHREDGESAISTVK